MEDGKISFLAHALLDIYGITFSQLQTYNYSSREEVAAIAYRSRDIFAYENAISKIFGVAYKGIADIVTRAECLGLPIKWKGKVLFDTENPFNEYYEVVFLAPVVEDSQCLYYLDMGFDRILHLEFQGLVRPYSGEFLSQFSNQHWAAMKFFERCVVFANRRYAFMAGEVAKGKAEWSSLVAWYFAENYRSYSQSQFALPMTVREARNIMGKIDDLPPGKGNARVKLGFSPCWGELRINDAFIFLIDDIHSSNGSVMTDGCGYISLSLARKLPYGIHQGKSSRPRGEAMPAPAIIQVRCACGRGLFKGCLLVTSDMTLCPEDCVVFRKSMKKAEKSPSRVEGDDCILAVVNTFEHPQILQRSKDCDMGEHCIRLNRSLSILLHHLGVPEEFFFELMRTEINNVQRALTNRSSAYSLVRQALFNVKDESSTLQNSINSSDEGNSGWLRDEEDGTDEFSAVDEYFDDADFEKYSPIQHVRLSVAEKARDFLVNGHDMCDPYFSLLLKQLQLNKVKTLQRCNLPVRRSVYLVGAPDLCDILAPDEVFVSLPIDHEQGASKALKLDHGYIVGPVLVSRHPMYHPGDIRRFHAVYRPEIANQLRFTNGGVVLFSTKGQRAPADMMSGGDYDGDQFVVIYSSDSQLMQINVAPPCEPDQPSSTTTNTTKASSQAKHLHDPTSKECRCVLCQDEYGWDMMRGLLRSAQNQFVGRYSNAWTAWADQYSPSHPKAIDCAKLCNIALDASKTGKIVPYRGDLLTYDAPNYMSCSDGRMSYESSSLLGKLFKMAISEFADVDIENEDVIFDFDLLYVVGHEAWNPDRLLSLHGMTYKARGYAKMSECCGQFYSWLPEYIPYLECWQSEIQSFRKQVANALDAKEGQGRKRTSSARFSESSFMDMDDILQAHRNKFIADAKRFADEYGLSETVGRNRVAGFVYLATYFHALQLRQKLRNKTSYSSKFRFALSYCWEICGVYLHENKRNRVKCLSMQSLADALPRTELRHLMG